MAYLSTVKSALAAHFQPMTKVGGGERGEPSMRNYFVSSHIVGDVPHVPHTP